MMVIAHFVAITCYIAAAGLAALPFARRVEAPVKGSCWVLAAGVLAHLVALSSLVSASGSGSLTGLGPALSFAGFVLAISLLLVEIFAQRSEFDSHRSPACRACDYGGNITGLHPFLDPRGTQAFWLVSHIVLSFIGMAAYATAAAAGTMYLDRAARAKVGPLWCDLPLLPTTRHARPSESHRVGHRILWTNDRTRSGWCLLDRIPHARRPATRMGTWRVDLRWRSRTRPFAARLAGASCRGDVSDHIRQRDGAVRRVPRNRLRQRTIPLTALPISLNGEKISALVVGGGKVGTRKALSLLLSGAAVRVISPDSERRVDGRSDAAPFTRHR